MRKPKFFFSKVIIKTEEASTKEKKRKPFYF